MKRLNSDFYNNPATTLAPMLLGKLLCVNKNGVITCVRITETEAYFGEEDTACHAHKGRTPRTEVLYNAGGTIYVYLCYRIHHLMNIISGTEGHPESVLIRGVKGYNGPGKLTKHLGINMSFNKLNVYDSEVIWIEDDGFVPKEILSSPRIGIDYATEEYRNKPWRFYYID